MIFYFIIWNWLIYHFYYKNYNWERCVKKWKKNKQVLLFTALIILLVGVASATEVSKDITDTNSISKEVVKQDTHKVSDTTNIIQNKKSI